MCFEINGLKTLKQSILRFFAQTPRLYIYYLNSSKNILLLKVIINFVIILWSFLKVKSQKSQRWYFAWDNLWWGFCVVVHFWCVSSFVDVLYFVVVCSFDFQATLPCHRQSSLASQVREGLHQLWALPQLLFIAFSFSSTASTMVLNGHFLPTGVF